MHFKMMVFSFLFFFGGRGVGMLLTKAGNYSPASKDRELKRYGCVGLEC